MTDRPHRFQGVCAAALTAVTKDFEPDTTRTIAHMKWLLDHGCDGINLLGTTGEAVSLSVKQRLEVMHGVAESEIPLRRVIVGTGAAALADAVCLTREAVECGFAGVLVIPPFYFKEISNNAAVAYYRRLIDQVDRPDLKLYLYHFPALSGVPFAIESIARLVEEFPEIVVGLKDSSGAPGFADEIAANFPGFDVFPSSEALLQRARDRGWAGCISASVNVTAPLAARVWKHNELEAQSALAGIRAILASFPMIPAVRYIVARLRHDDAWMRAVPPLGSLNPLEQQLLDARLVAAPAFPEIADVWSRTLARERPQHS